MIFIAKENKSTFVPASTPEGRERQQAAIRANYAKKSEKQKKPKTRWNRVHFFKRKKSTKTVGHPVYVYGQNSRNYKYLTFTHKPEEGKEDDYELLKHNIDPEEDGTAPTYVKKSFEINRRNDFRDPDKKYRIHDEDAETIKQYKK